jgi:hypothetical protein
MRLEDLIARHPLQATPLAAADLLAPGDFGAVTARAGVGKTALLVQLALSGLLHGEHVLHISLNDPVDKVNLYYREVFRNLTAGLDAAALHECWDELLRRRFIMTFRVEGFSVPKLEERLTDLTAQGIFTPRMLIVDGLPFERPEHNTLCDIKALVRQQRLKAWFTVRTHRHEAPGPDGLPNQLQGVADLFRVILTLQPEGKEIHLQTVKGTDSLPAGNLLRLDPAAQLGAA